MNAGNVPSPGHDSAVRPPAIFLMGPTATGKSGIALDIAGYLPVEIVSVDSAQVYRHMDIGTAKPDARSMAAVRHHLVDLIDPHEHYSAARFTEHARIAMREITGRGNIPLLVGGTMLYFRALLEGLSPLPAADGGLRTHIEERAEANGWPALHAELQRLDPASAARIRPTDSQRIQRALEVCHLTGKPMSKILDQPRHARFPYHPIRMILNPGDRHMLHRRIAQRFDRMLERGLVDEVRTIRDKFRLNDASPSMRCVGYRQVRMYLDDEVGLEAMRDMAIVATRQLAKRQLTWLRPMKNVQTFDCLEEDLPSQVRKYLRNAGLAVRFRSTFNWEEKHERWV